MTFICSELDHGKNGFSGKCCFVMKYCEWYGVCDFVVLAAVELCADYGGVNVFHVSLNFGIVYGVGVLCQCLWCNLCCCMLFVSYVWVLFVVYWCDVVGGVL